MSAECPPLNPEHRVLNPHLTSALKLCVLVPLLLLASCRSSSKIKGVPANLPTIALHDSAATPSHSMSHADYPFDSGGRYVTAWAAEGEKRAGRDPSAGSDYSSWRSSHGSSGGRSSGVKKVSSSSSRSKSTASTKKKSTGGSKYTIKKGDTLSAIARKNGTTVAKIKAANGLKSDLIRDGKTLTIPR